MISALNFICGKTIGEAKQMLKSISVVIPCYNEAENIDDTCENVLAAVEGQFEDVELLIFNDGSTDKTDELIDQLALQHSQVQAVHNPKNMGYGYNYLKALEMAKMTYLMVIPGDNEISRESIRRISSLTGKADMIVPFTINLEIRPYSRRLLSRIFTLVCNSVFKCELQYYNAPTVHRVDLLRALKIDTHGFAFQAIMLIKLIRAGHSFTEVEMFIQRKKGHTSTALKPMNIISVIWSLSKLALEIYVLRRYSMDGGVNRINPHD